MHALSTFRLSVVLSAIVFVLGVGAEGAAQEPGAIVAADSRVQGRTSVYSETGARVPYALLVPRNYDRARKWPLIVGLHGLGRPYDRAGRT
jgi:predicted peptidase